MVVLELGVTAAAQSPDQVRYVRHEPHRLLLSEIGSRGVLEDEESPSLMLVTINLLSLIHLFRLRRSPLCISPLTPHHKKKKSYLFISTTL